MEEEKKELEEKLLLCEKERDEYLNGWKRAKADMINAKKEWEEQIKGLNDFIKSGLVKDFLPILDALEATQDIPGWQEIKKLAEDTLKKMGLEPIEAIGEQFDPNYHEAMAEGEGEPDTVIEVLQKGYKINGRVIRAAKVRVGRGQV